MPARYVIDKEQQLVISIGSDRLTFAEVTTHQDQLRNDPDFNSELNQLIDLRAATSLDLSVDEAKINCPPPAIFTDIQRAFVATNPAIFGMGRMMEAYNELSNVASQVGILRFSFRLEVTWS